jgi:hypothetical protein
MKKTEHYILMADVVSSRSKDQKQLMQDFKQITASINQQHQSQLESPLTITLGDEFQGVVKSVKAALQIILSIDEEILFQQEGFQLRYVLLEGRIDTPINEKIAYGMLGEGLTNARKALQEAKATTQRYHFDLKNKKMSHALTNSFIVYQGLTDDWKVERDHALIMEFLKAKDYKVVAEELGKTRSQIWKRQKSLRINEYIAIKEVINYIAH